MPTEGSEDDDPLRWLGPGDSHRSSNFQSNQFASERPSIGRRISRTLARFFFAVLIGVGTTLAWQSYRKEAKEVVTTWVPSLGWLLPVSATMTSASTETSPELGQQLKPIALDLALIRRSVEQLASDLKDLAAKQEQIAHDTIRASAGGSPDPAPQTHATLGTVTGHALMVKFKPDWVVCKEPVPEICTGR